MPNVDPYQLSELSPDRPMKLLLFNSGSRSVRYDFLDTEKLAARLSGMIEGVGGRSARHGLCGPGVELDERLEVRDHRQAVDVALARLAADGLIGPAGEGLDAIGHRVLYSPGQLGSAARVDDALMAALSKASYPPWRDQQRILALAHCRERLPDVPQLAVFDGAFFRTMPEYARLYGLPYRYYKQFGIERLGFQGLSHKYAGLRAAAHLSQPFEALKIVSVHLGNGASLCAMDHGRAVDTTMGLTPLQGPVQGQRSGDLDPGLVLHLMELEDMGPARLARMLEEESGLLGLSGVSHDMRAVLAAAGRADPRALLALEVYCHNVRRHLGGMVTALDGLEVLVFTGGIGENSAGVRARVCQGLTHLGVLLDEQKNIAAAAGEVVDLGRADSRVRVLAVRSDEARMIAREVVRALDRSSLNLQIQQAGERTIPIGVSAHHVHLTDAHVEALFGPGARLTPKADLLQPGQFAAEERVNLIGPRGRVDRVRVLGPVRDETQVEISRTEEFALGIDAPVRNSGDLQGTPGLLLEGPAGQVALDHGVICARRHIHMHPDDAAHFGVRDRDIVTVEVGGERPLIFGDVLCRVKTSYVLEMHVDTDEANAGEITSGASGRLIGIQSRPG